MRPIDADKARENSTIDLITHFLDRQPTIDAVEVVRCVDCVYRSRFANSVGHYICNHPSIAPVIFVNGDHFCGYGERMEAEHG